MEEFKKVFDFFSVGEIEKGQKEIKKIAMTKNINKMNTEDKRLVYYNMAWAEDLIGDKRLAYKYIERCIDIITKDEEYMNNKLNKINIDNALTLKKYIDNELKNVDIEKYRTIEYFNKKIEYYRKEKDCVNEMLYIVKKYDRYGTFEEIDETFCMLYNFSVRGEDEKESQQLQLILLRMLEYLRDFRIEIFNKLNDIYKFTEENQEKGGGC